MDSPIDHPLLPLLWQKFFILYLTRIPLSSSTNNTGCVGDKFFAGLVNFGFLKRIKKRLQETLDYYKDKSSDDAVGIRKHFVESCVKYCFFF